MNVLHVPLEKCCAKRQLTMRNRITAKKYWIGVLSRTIELSEIPSEQFSLYFCPLWREIRKVFTKRRILSQRGKFIYYSPYEPIVEDLKDITKKTRR